MRSCASGECSSYAGPVSAKTPALAVAPAAPADLSVDSWSSQNGGQVTLKWTPSAVPAYSGFRVYRSDDGGDTFNVIATFDTGTFTGAGNKFSDAVSSNSAHIYKIKTYQTAQSCQAVDNSTSEKVTWANFSAFSPQLIVPARPEKVSLIDFSVQSNGTQAQFGWTASQYADSYNFQVATNETFTANPRDFSYTDTKSAFINFSQNTSFYYRVRACSGSGVSKCSDFQTSTTPYYSGLVGPTNVTYVLTLKSGGLADVNLFWQDTADYKHNTRIYRMLSTDTDYTLIKTLTPINCGGDPETCDYIHNFTDSDLTAGDLIYKYKLIFIATDGSEGLPIEISVDMKATPVKNWGWASVGQDLGIGWLRTSFDALNSAWGVSNQSADSNHPYNVYIDRNNSLHGYTWTKNYGWLSFDPQDLNGCPSGTCAPTVSVSTSTAGQVSGWAKFLAADPTLSSWSGWVSLRGTAFDGSAYGLCYGDAKDANGGICLGNGSTTNNKFSGFAWGGDVTGWLGFNNANVLGAPVITNIISPDPNTVKIEWTNPESYKSMEFYITKDPTAPKTRFDLKLNQSNTPIATSTGSHVDFIGGLSTSTDYRIFIRGYLR